MRNFNYKNLDIYKISRKLIILVYRLTSSFPEQEHGLNGLVSQIRRASISVSSNIAEGSSRKNKQMLHFLSLSNGSLREVETQLSIAYDLKFISKEEFEKCYILFDECFAKLTNYMRKIDREILEEERKVIPKQR
jgi:four helix bundle protein